MEPVLPGSTDFKSLASPAGQVPLPVRGLHRLVRGLHPAPSAAAAVPCRPAGAVRPLLAAAGEHPDH